MFYWLQSIGLKEKVLVVTKFDSPKKFKNTPDLIDQSKDKKGTSSHKENPYSRPVSTKAVLCFLTKFLNLRCSLPTKVITVFLILELLYIDTNGVSNASRGHIRSRIYSLTTLNKNTNIHFWVAKSTAKLWTLCKCSRVSCGSFDPIRN